MKLLSQKIVIFAMMVSLLSLGQGFFSTPVLAGECPEGEGVSGVDFLVFHGPIVPCGRNTACSSKGTEPCTLCHLIIMFKNVFDLVFSLVIVATTLMLTIAGVLYIVSAGGGMMTVAKGILKKTLLGFALFLFSWFIIITVMKLLSAKTALDSKGLFNFTCKTETPTNGTGEVRAEIQVLEEVRAEIQVLEEVRAEIQVTISPNKD